MTRRRAPCLALATALFAAGCAGPQPPLPELMRLIDVRHTQAQYALYPENPDVPADLAGVARAAEGLAALVRDLPRYDPPIAGDDEDFRTLAAAVQRQSRALADAAARRDEEGSIAAFDALGAACASCHEMYRWQPSED